MRLTRILKCLSVGVLLLMMSGCGSSEAIVDPMAMLAYGKDPSDQNLESLAKSYSTVINRNRKTGLKQSAIYSDYAVALIKQGRRAEANSWMNKEMNDFPESRGYILKLKTLLIPEYANDNSIDLKYDDADSTQSQEPALTPAKRAAAEERASEVMEQTNKEMDSTSDNDQDKTEDVSKNEDEGKVIEETAIEENN